MKVQGISYTTVWVEGTTVCMIDQNQLPFRFEVFRAREYTDVCHAIRTMITRGAGSIGAAAGFAMAQAFAMAPQGHAAAFVEQAKRDIEATRPTARDLFAATDRVFQEGSHSAERAMEQAQAILQEYGANCRRIGELGSSLLKDGDRVLTHCNAGWLGVTDWGTALSPVYVAKEQGKKIFVWVDETRPRAQGARLTAWELANEGIAHTIVPDNAGAFLMQRSLVDMVIVGADRIAVNGDAANKIGTLEKAVVAHHYGVPFYVAAPKATFDSLAATGQDIPIEERTGDEVLFQEGPDEQGQMHRIRVCNPNSGAFNPSFDVTPAALITGIITEDGIQTTA